MPRDAVPKTEVTVSSAAPAPTPPPASPPPSSEMVVAAAVEMGKAAEAAETAAARAEAAAGSVSPELANLRAELRSEIAQVAEIVGNLQQIVEEEAEELEPDGITAPVPVSAAVIDVPPAANPNPPHTPTTAQKTAPKSGRSGFARAFLGR